MSFSCYQYSKAEKLTVAVNFLGVPAGEDALCEAGRLRGLIEDIVADVFIIEARLLRQATRGRARVALARQVAMYIAHVGYGLSLTEVGRIFERDRTTVAHACHVVEHKRDDETFDRAMMLLEMIIRTINGSGVLGNADEAERCNQAGYLPGGLYFF